MKTRFDLEQEILDCWNVTKDIDTLLEAVMEKELTHDKISNILLGIKELYELKFDRTFRTFESVIVPRKI